MPSARTLAAPFLLLTLAASAQTAAPAVRVYHPATPLPSYDVATIKPPDLAGTVSPNGGRTVFIGSTIRNYIRGAYSPSGASLATSQVIGGPDWIDKDRYIIQGKPPADLEVAMKNMKRDDRIQLEDAMRQSLLADRFHLKVHFEVREMPVYALVPAKGGLKLKPIADPAPAASDSVQSPPTANKRPADRSMTQIMMSANGVRVLKARDISMAQFAGMISGFIEQTSSNFIGAGTGSRPVLDETGFTGSIDVDSLRWSASLSAAPEDNAATPNDAPSLENALEQTLGLKVISTKGPVEVVVIDSIDRPSGN